MEALLTYLFKSAGLLSIFHLAYIVLLIRDTNFQVNRRFLLGGIFASAILPAIYFTRKVIVEANNFSLNQIPITTQEVSGNLAATLGIWEVLGTVYIFIATFFLSRITFQLYGILKLISNSTISKNGNFKFIKTDTAISPFSFFKFIVYNPETHSEQDLEMILLHEKIHASQLHSLDIIIANLTTALLWFNPLSWLYKKSVEQNLEYIADKETVALSGAKKSYQQALVKVSITNSQPALTNHFYQSFIKKRILMLNKKTTKNPCLWKISLVFPAILAFMLIFNVKTQASNNLSENNTRFNINSKENQKVLEANFSENTSKADLEKFQHAFAEKMVKLEWRDLKYSANKLKNINISYTLEKGDTQTFQSETDKNGNMLAFKIAAKFHEAGKIAFIFIGNKKPNEPTDSRLTEVDVETIKEEKLPEDLIYKIDGKKAFKKDVESLDPENIAKVQVLKGKKAIHEAGKNGENGVILISTKISKKPKKIPGDPIYILNGEKSKMEIIELIDNKLIESVNVLKGESAISLYGEEAKDGAVIITTKVLDRSSKRKNTKKGKGRSFGFQRFQKKTDQEIMSGKEIGFRTGEDINAFQWTKESDEKINFHINLEEKIGPVIIIDGKKSNEAILKEIKSVNIEKINVLKGKSAIDKYGEEAENGAIEVTTKKEIKE
ncbi:TonB-dependent outer membrane receptor, SusC/RagA subfamily, signature region [Salegentibacter holothuriorum]|uniref:TonB-dependent outer membrane receptor, SusC/RagA subfamily, signature region n=1 Tax=Salegentibacter holothuriorum TaxID=241145 RepID=A0A1T5D128_9FLAO|nr:M56 family metallopeptidase [Salegentibacter holothuriorum]SKB65438.1 TonB-dependent outer membrane receptor, SusC/RagA subfamily, signature region [Salegentibacter holothuriorum]